MNESAYQQIRETAWKRRLTAAEEKEVAAYLARHPHGRAAWEEEHPLTELLQQIPDAPVPSNFTAQVMLALQTEAAKSRRASMSYSWWKILVRGHWLPRTATALVIVSVALVGQHQMHVSRRAELARSLMAVSPLASSQDVEVWNDFDAIQRLGQLSAQVDTDLLQALQ